MQAPPSLSMLDAEKLFSIQHWKAGWSLGMTLLLDSILALVWVSDGLAPRLQLISVAFEHCTLRGLHRKYCGITTHLWNVNMTHTIRNVQMQQKSTVKALVLSKLLEPVILPHYFPWNHTTQCSDAHEINWVLVKGGTGNKEMDWKWSLTVCGAPATHN